MTAEVKVSGVTLGGSNPLAVIAGPCVIESEDSSLRTAEAVKKVAASLKMGFIFKSSYRKDNRSSPTAYSGPGLDEGLRILERVREEVGVPVLSDVHCRDEVEAAAQVLDVLQIPAYLSQQTRLALKVGATGRVVNLKKGQFIGPREMRNSIGKIEHTGNRNIMVTERGSCFGYNSLVVDVRSFPILASFGYPVIFDVTHSVRIYGTPSGDPAGGEPQYIPYLARAAVAAGCDGIFIETHENPNLAKCDACSMLPTASLRGLLEELLDIDEVRRHHSGRKNEG